MSLQIECHSKWTVIKNGMSLKVECHSKWTVIKNGMSFIVTQNKILLKRNVTQNGMSHKKVKK